MKKYIIIPLLFISALCWGQAQFIVQNGSSTQVFSNINDAISNASNGDTLYIPGGGFSITNTTIDKTLHWVGHGHYPDDTQATLQSRIVTPLTFSGNCDNSSFEGIYFSNTLNFGSDGDDATDITMKRCRLGSTLTMRPGATDTVKIDFTISECVLNGNVFANYGTNCLVEKSLLFGYVSRFVLSDFVNNDFPALSGCTNCSSRDRTIQHSFSCLFVNNVFSYQFGLYGSESNTLSYNLFDRSLPFNPATGTNSGTNNIVDVAIADIYTSIENDAYNTFSYTNNYQLKAGSTGTAQDGTPNVSIQNAGSDGTNMGIFGTALPYKTIPYYPHINSATIADKVVNDKLGVNINVQSQNR